MGGPGDCTGTAPGGKEQAMTAPAGDRASRESVEPLYKAREPHWTPRGNRVAAEAQAPFLAPLVCGMTAARQEAGQR